MKKIIFKTIYKLSGNLLKFASKVNFYKPKKICNVLR